MIAKLALIFGVVAGALVLSLQVAGVLEANESYQLLAKVFGIIAILGVAGGLIGMIAGGGKNSKGEPPSSKAGPQF